MTNEGSLEGSLGSLRQFHLTNEGSLEGSLGSLRKFYLTNEGSLGGSLEGSLEGSRHLTCLPSPHNLHFNILDKIQGLKIENLKYGINSITPLKSN